MSVKRLEAVVRLPDRKKNLRKFGNIIHLTVILFKFWANVPEHCKLKVGQVTWPTSPKVLSVQNGLNRSDPFMSDNNRISLVDQVSFAHFDHICSYQLFVHQILSNKNVMCCEIWYQTLKNGVLTVG